MKDKPSNLKADKSKVTPFEPQDNIQNKSTGNNVDVMVNLEEDKATRSNSFDEFEQASIRNDNNVRIN